MTKQSLTTLPLDADAAIKDLREQGVSGRAKIPQ